MPNRENESLFLDIAIQFAFWGCFLLIRIVMVAFALAVSQIGAAPPGMAIAVLGPLLIPLFIILLHQGEKNFCRL